MATRKKGAAGPSGRKLTLRLSIVNPLPIINSDRLPPRRPSPPPATPPLEVQAEQAPVKKKTAAKKTAVKKTAAKRGGPSRR